MAGALPGDIRRASTVVVVGRVKRLRQALFGMSLLAFLLAPSRHSFAQDGATTLRAAAAAGTEAPAGSPTPATASAASPRAVAGSDGAAALTHYQQALSRYSSGDVQGAFESMQQSYLLSGRAELLFNLARLERELQRCQPALRDYDRYLRVVPNGKFRSDAEQAVQELRRECPVRAIAQPELILPAAQPVTRPEPHVHALRLAGTPPNPPANEASYWSPSRVVGWSAITSGVLSGGLALYFLNAAIANHDEVKKLAASYDFAPPNPPWLGEQEAQHRNLRAARVLGITSGALIASGAAVLILSPKTQSTGSASAMIAAYPGYLGAVCSGSF